MSRHVFPARSARKRAATVGVIQARRPDRPGFSDRAVDETETAETILISGASSGIGYTTAKHLTRRGFRVFGASRSRPEAPDDVEWLTIDVDEAGSVRRGIDTVLARTGRIDAIVCSAGFGLFGSVEEVSIAQAKAQFETNYFGTLRVVRAVLPHMRQRRRGRIILIGSLSGRAPIPFQAHYSASKAATDALAQALHNEVRAFGLFVSLIEPGDIHTAFNARTDWSALQGSVYGQAIHRCAEVVRASLVRAPSPALVAATVERALRAPGPRLRYSVGPQSSLVSVARRLLPERLCLSLVRAHFGL